MPKKVDDKLNKLKLSAYAWRRGKHKRVRQTIDKHTKKNTGTTIRIHELFLVIIFFYIFLTFLFLSERQIIEFSRNLIKIFISRHFAFLAATLVI